MNENNKSDMPISFQMALAHNIGAMNVFLKLKDSEQDEIINKAKSVQTKREIQMIVDSIPKMHLN